MKKRIALLGAGTVGAGVCRLLAENGDMILDNNGVEIEIAAILVRDLNKERPGVPKELLTDDFEKIMADDSIVLVAEAMGGVHPALEYALRVLKAGKCFVTANKELLSQHFEELERTAFEHGTGLYFEPSVAGAVPVIKALTDSLAANRIYSVMGIINGTTNYILSKMSEENMGYAEALAEATELGYAEPDPTNDVEGYDARFKLSILSSLAFDRRVYVKDIFCEGITAITADDMRVAKDMGYGIKLLAIGKMEDDKIQVRVHPTMLPLSHPLCSVNGSFNAVFVNASAAGEMMFYGRGAGDMPTASAMAGDILHALMQETRRRYPFVLGGVPAAQITDDWNSAFFLSSVAQDEPLVLARVANIFGKHGVSLKTVLQPGEASDGCTRVILITHITSELKFRKALEELKELDCIEVRNIIRVEE
ncbi:MAG: homoserine dehydrogenase [Clostridia bacterium]|nr:homoserine dehydrogenase [Clostridia bacterium]